MQLTRHLHAVGRKCAGDDGKPYGEARSLSFSLARGTHGTAVRLDQVPDDRKTEAQSGMRARRRAIALPEPIEDER